MNPKLWSRIFGTRRLLWLGFGLLTLVMVSIGIIAIVRVRSVASSFEKQIKVAKPRSATARELELNVLDYSLGVHQYLRGDDLARQRTAKYAANLALQLDGYTALAETARQRELAGRLRTGWREVYALGEALMAARTANREEVARFAEIAVRLERFLDTELRPDAEIIFNALSAETHGSLQKSEIVTLSLLFLGLTIALLTGWAVVRAVLASEARLRDSEERLT
ncbi:MAG: hypothetical protein ACXW6R_22560, partial [Candidatus Binatia bacterium]